MDIVLTIASFLLVLGVLVVVHEVGHFVASKIARVRVDEFGIGFPPRLFGKTWHGTKYSVNLLPLGGFVKIKGIGSDNAASLAHDSFQQQPFRVKVSILLAGIIMNVGTAFVLLSITFALGFQMPKEALLPGGTILAEDIAISSVFPESPAQIAGILPGDVLVQINSETITSVKHAQSLIREEQGNQSLHLVVRRNKQEFTMDVAPSTLSTNGESFVGIGVGLLDIVTVRYPLLQSFRLGSRATFSVTGQIFSSFYSILRDLVQQQTLTQDVTGPIGIAVLTRHVTQQGIVPLLQFSALLSLNLAIFNLLPIPALDGGRLLFVIIEKIRRKPLSQELEGMIHNVGFVLLLLFIAIVTFRDIQKF